MQMAVFKAFRKIFQKHLNKDTYNHKNPDIMIFRMVNFWKNFIQANRYQKTGTQNKKIFGELLLAPEIFSEKYTNQNA